MAILKFEDAEIEKKVIAYNLLGADYWLSIPEAWFQTDIALNTYREIQKFIKPPYSSFPSIDVISDHVDNLDVKLYLQEVSALDIELRDRNVYLQNMYEMYAARKIYNVSLSIPHDLEVKKVQDIIKDKIQILTNLINPLEAGEREKFFIWQNARDRWDYYKQTELNPNMAKKIPFGIEAFDELTRGGLGEAHLLLLFAGTGGFKSKTKANLAYNMSFISRKSVMVLTLEIPMSDFEAIIDSRHSGLSFNGIVDGKLHSVDREIYRSSLADIYTQKYPMYIVDIPDKATTADIIRELEVYRAVNGAYPEVLVIDYANEMEPVTPWSNTSEKFKNLGVELRRIARTYNIRIITSMQLNREGKKLKQPKDVDLEHVSESHYFTNVFHIVAYLYQDNNGVDAASNILNWSIKKNRYGKKDVVFETFANPDINYIGDRKIKMITS